MSRDVEMTFMEHLEELRTRILYCVYAIAPAVLISFSFARPLLEIITRHAHTMDIRGKSAGLPLEVGFSPLIGPFITYRSPQEVPILQSLAVTETAVTYMKVAFVAAIFLIFPFIMYQVWKFVEPGLKQKEKKFLGPFLLVSWFFFILGGLFAYFGMLPVAIPLLSKFGEGITVNAWALGAYVSFVLRMLLVFGIVFELPVIAALLSMLGILTPQFLKSYRSYAILVIFVMAAFLTPPDPATQILMAVPLMMLYEISIFVSWFFQPTPDPETAVVESQGD